MLDYLVTSVTRKRLLGFLWGQGTNGTVSELARLSQVSFAAAYEELRAMRRAGLAISTRVGNAAVFSANSGHPRSKLLRELFEHSERPAEHAMSSTDDSVRLWLKQLGAPLAVEGKAGKMPAIERVVACALHLAHRDASVARVLPLVIWRNKDRLDMDRLVLEARRADEKQALGFFVDLAATLGNDKLLGKYARALRDRRVRRRRGFFVGPRSRFDDRLAAANTPPVAKRWCYRMNMGMDSFESLFAKHSRSDEDL